MKYTFLIGLMISMCMSNLYGQQTISGKIINEETKESLPYANITLTNIETDSLFGVASEINGQFKLKAIPKGLYTLKVSVIGYDKKTIDSIVVANDAIKLGEIGLKYASDSFEGVAIEADQSYIETKPGKKVINVGKDIVNAGGSAIEILTMAPSVEIGVQGEVSIRGESDIFILINGRETALSYLDPAQALKQIPASSIEKIEIITNAGAEYGPDGMGGMINIILKKEVDEGFKTNIGGSFSGVPYSGSANGGIEYKKGKLRLSLNYNIDKENNTSRVNSTRNYTSTDSEISHLYNDLDSKEGELYHFLMGGLSYQFTDSAEIGLTFFAEAGQSNENTLQDNSFFLTDGETFNSLMSSNTSEKEAFVGLELAYAQEFKNDKSLEFTSSWSSGTFGYNSLINMEDIYSNTFTSEGTFSFIEAKLNYELPLLNFMRIKSGIESEILNFKLDQANSDPAIPVLNSYSFKQNKHAFFLVSEWDLMIAELALGARAELFDSKGIENAMDGETFSQTYFNIFPNVQLSTYLSERQGIMFSYSKRINRPEYEQLSPTSYYEDPLNVIQGNPNLLPEFAHIFEIGHEIYGKKWSAFTTLFQRVTTNVIQERQELLDDNVILSTYSNEGKRVNSGIEFYLMYSPTNWWELSNDFTVYNKVFKGQTTAIGFRDGVNWSNKINNDFKLGSGFKMQLQAKLIGRQTSLFYSSDPYYTINWGASKLIFKEKAQLSIGVRDIFNSVKLNYNLLQSDFTQSSTVKYNTRLFNLGFNYNF